RIADQEHTTCNHWAAGDKPPPYGLTIFRELLGGWLPVNKDSSPTTHHPSPATESYAAEVREKLSSVVEALGQVIVGQSEVVDQVLTALVAGGHVLLEGVPGLGKTLLVRTLGQVTGLTFGRVQFTPDLMPGDITGTELF